MLAKLVERLRRNRPAEAYGLSGNYQTWNEALTASTGYESSTILDKTRVALLKVKRGEAAYERDSVLFDHLEYSWPLLSGLLWAAARSGGQLNVLDFGGSLGSTYFQNRVFLSVLAQVRWNIVEQPGHVAIGKADFEDDTLRFYGSITNCVADTRPNVVLLSSVLQYLERPHALLEEIMGLDSDHVIIDRTPFWAGPADRLCLQTVPPFIYPGSYPSWIFSRPHFESRVNKGWAIIATFDNTDWMPAPIEMAYQGIIISRKDRQS